MALLDDIREQFPDLVWLLNDPQIGKLLREAVDPNKGFSAQRFEAKVRQTQWWKKNSASQRSWAIKAHTDPASANEDRRSYMAQLNQQAARLGVKLNANELRFMTEVNLQHGRAPNDPTTMYQLAQLRNRPGHAVAGAIKTETVRTRAMSYSDYFMPMSNSEAHSLGSKIARGVMTTDDVQAMLQERAASRFPHLAARLKAGETMKTMFAGHIATIADELELSPETIDLTRSRWSKVVDQVDPKTGEHRPLSLYETKVLARQDPRFWRTQHGQAEDAQMATMMAQTFGKRA
jgi:hypothetical protein